MMEINNKGKKVAIVTESLWRMGGANRVLDIFAEMYPSADIYALFGEKKNLSNNIQKHNIHFSFLNKIPFVKYLYRYTFNLWPLAIESFDLSKYDLVISSSHSVAHGVIVPFGSQHLAYIHSPMRYAWDQTSMYTNTLGFSFLKRAFIDFNLNFIRMWDTTAASRPDILVSNSNFVKKRIEKFWGRKVDYVVTPPVEFFQGKIVLKRKNYFVSGAPFEPNKGGKELLLYASKLGFNLKIIGDGSLRKRLERKYKNSRNIEFLGVIDELEKWKVLSNAKGYILTGVEDYGIFPCEAISCGTPVLAFDLGGVKEIVVESKNGILYKEQTLDCFTNAYEKFCNTKWNYENVSKKTTQINDKSSFVKKIQKSLVDNG